MSGKSATLDSNEAVAEVAYLALSIFGNRGDAMAVRATGFALLASGQMAHCLLSVEMGGARWVRIGLAVLGGLVLVAQGFRIERRNPPVESEIPASPEVRALLRRACYDCHSNETNWPWYSHVAPVSWLLAHDVRQGRAELNFSSWAAYDPAKRTKTLKESAEEVAEGDMPPWYYRLARRDARLTPDEVTALGTWAAAQMTSR